MHFGLYPPSPLPFGRHWKELMQITGRELNLAEDVLKLRHLLSGPGGWAQSAAGTASFCA